MSPEYGATCGIFPIDKETLHYLRLTGRSEEQIALVEAYCREQGLFHDEKTPEAEYSELLTLDLATVEPSLAGPKRPQDRVVLSQAGESFNKALPSLIKPKVCGEDCRDHHRRRQQRKVGAGRRKSRCHRRRRSECARACLRLGERFAEARQRRHRRDHFLHQHFESFGADRRGTAREESGRERTVRSGVGQDLARSRIEGRDATISRRPD